MGCLGAIIALPIVILFFIFHKPLKCSRCGNEIKRKYYQKGDSSTILCPACNRKDTSEERQRIRKIEQERKQKERELEKQRRQKERELEKQRMLKEKEFEKTNIKRLGE